MLNGLGAWQEPFAHDRLVGTWKQACLSCDVDSMERWALLQLRPWPIAGSVEGPHNRGPEWRGGPDRQKFAHRAAVEIAGPHSDRVICVESHTPSITESRTRPGLYGGAFGKI